MAAEDVFITPENIKRWADAHTLKVYLIAGELGVANHVVRFATTPEGLRLTGCPRGSMPPFGHVRELRTLVDQSLLARETVYALTTDAEVLMQGEPGQIVDATSALVGRFA